jgi:hypothetical protein
MMFTEAGIHLDLDIAVIGETDTQGTYVFEVNHPNVDLLRRVVVFARRQLMQEITKKGYNILVVEGFVNQAIFLILPWVTVVTSWRLTTYRRGKQCRVEVQYRGRRESIPSPTFIVLMLVFSGTSTWKITSNTLSAVYWGFAGRPIMIRKEIRQH